MRWLFWQKKQDDDGGDSEDSYDRPAKSACKHLWTNWSDPVESTIPSYTMFGGADSTRDALVQSRRCLTCNMHERRCI